jgi:CO/xanthine dehydrogenase FAD-binding subunit
VVETFRPSTLQEALCLRARHGAVPFAGGTDLMVRLRGGAGVLPCFTRPVLFLDQLPGLRGLSAGGEGLEIGAMTTLRDVAASDLAHSALRDAVAQMGGPALRAIATLGGNVCNASPAGDTLPFLYAFDARLRLVSESGERVVAISDFITGPGRTRLRPDELLRSVLIPAWLPSRALWRKVGTRKANALTKVSIAAFADLGDTGGTGAGGTAALPADGARAGAALSRVRIALGAVGPAVVRLTAVEALLEGAAVSDIGALGPRIRDAVRGAVHPIDDQRSTADYRREVAAGLVEDFVSGLAAADGTARTDR